MTIGAGVSGGADPTSEEEGGLEQQTKKATIQAKARQDAVKIHGPNSPQVLSGEVPLGHREPIQNESGDQIVELTYVQCVEMFGQEWADDRFRGVPQEER